jgi:hypothetical protein
MIIPDPDPTWAKGSGSNLGKKFRIRPDPGAEHSMKSVLWIRIRMFLGLLDPNPDPS